jgi:glycosyltransferase involved in cell wall biosynthesis
MNVLHFILGKANKDRANGVNQVIAGLAKYSAGLGADVRVIGKAESVDAEGEIIARDGFSVEAYSHWSRRLRSALIKGVRWADVVHLHGVYSQWNLLVGRMCEEIGRPYIVTLHDGLAPERSEARGRLKKLIFHAVLQRRHLARAAGVHLLTEEEATILFAVAQPQKVFCIPNGVDLDDYPSPNAPKDGSSNEIDIGYLGRLSPEKNLDALCFAFSKINTEHNMRLKLAGPPSAYGDSLLKRFADHGVEGVGAKFGGEKAVFMRSMDLFVHPSLCDVFSIAAMEVLAVGTPLLITRTSNASYFYDRGAFFMCEPSVFGLERGMRLALGRQADWPEMSVRGRRLINDRLNWHTAASDMLEAYGQIVAGRP